MIGSCMQCGHCDTSRKNDIGQVRCKRYSTYVSLCDRCDQFYNKDHNYVEEEKIFKSIMEGMGRKGKTNERN